MKARYKFLCDHSIGLALSAIEVYNKPTFREREQVFTILMVAAWESLFKAKLLFDNRNRMSLLWVKDGHRYKKNRAGERLTIGLPEAMNRCPVPTVVKENIERLIEVRNAAVHLTAESPALPSLVFALGAASLRNYARLVRTWFNVGLNDYEFFILPLGFAYPFKTLSLADVKHEPEEVARLLGLIAQAQDEKRTDEDDYHLVCEIEMQLVSAKKVTEKTDIVAGVTGDLAQTVVVKTKVRPIDQYPLRFSDLWKQVVAAVPGAKQGAVFEVIRVHRMKDDPKYCCHNYRSKADELRGPDKLTPVLYNDDALRFIIKQLQPGK